MATTFDRRAKRIIQAAMRYHRRCLRGGYGKFASLNVNMSRERRALFDACAAYVKASAR